ncbi:DNA-3-methyladenine glycosylase I [Desulforhabdus sp. TSK]|uniref:DNA-3-methyladenine glycosylase I n=1 Tax=Desulforhabdus sp. TSK TaxID=2925014 RepID=UPI001FC8D286|nr:DNA-3-methyladenine glycosylase I [Desulforhabdus sp. TSK]GKT07002.1 DNA-3-methyladenine glycosylase [Desulforhabdus sp. TSK]
MTTRCQWCGESPLYKAYHDNEWGVPVHDDRLLFEFLILEGAQAGLSWQTILKKREGYRKAFQHFDIQTVASYTVKDIDRLLSNPDIVRNRLKIQSTVKNAQATLTIIEEIGSFDTFLWRYVGGTPIQNTWKTIDEVPAKTDLSDAMSRDLKKRGFRFVGSTICYAFMQAVGMVNDHTTDCFRYRQIKELEVSGKDRDALGRANPTGSAHLPIE